MKTEITATQITRERVTIELSDLEIRNIMKNNIDTDDIIKELRSRIHQQIVNESAKIAWDAWSKANPSKNPFTDFIKPKWGQVNESKMTISRHLTFDTIDIELTVPQMKMLNSLIELEKSLGLRP